MWVLGDRTQVFVFAKKPLQQLTEAIVLYLVSGPYHIPIMLLGWFSSAFLVAAHSHMGLLFIYDHISNWISESHVKNEPWTSQLCTVLANGDWLKLVTEWVLCGLEWCQKLVSELPETSGHLPAAAVRPTLHRGLAGLSGSWWGTSSCSDSMNPHSSKWQECLLGWKRMRYLAWSGLIWPDPDCTAPAFSTTVRRINWWLLLPLPVSLLWPGHHVHSPCLSQESTSEYEKKGSLTHCALVVVFSAKYLS